MLEVLAPLGWWSQANDVSLRGSCIEGLVSDSEANVSTQMTSLRGRNQNSDDANNHMYVRVTGELKS